jgi:hypothetical protein
LIIFIQAFFSKAKTAAIAGTMIFYGTGFLDSTVRDPSTEYSAKRAASILANVGISRAVEVLAMFEDSSVGLQFDNWGDMYQNYTFQTCLN